MMFIAFQAITIVIAGLMVGNELAVGAFVHPRLYTLDDKIHVASAQVLARIYGAVMPVWYALTLALTIAIAFLFSQAGTTFIFAVTSAGLWLTAILFTISRLVPINSQVSHWDLESLPSDWKQLRNQWDRLHVIRVLILVIALVCLIVACLMQQHQVIL